MELTMIQGLLEVETWINIANELGWAGPFLGIVMTIIEAIFPPLPLALFVTLNVMMFGLVKGYILSWIGTCIGSILVYMLLVKIGGKRFDKIKKKYKLVDKASNWVHAKGGKAIFVLLCFPFTPSIAVALLGAIANVERKAYIKAVILGKLVMIFILSLYCCLQV